MELIEFFEDDTRYYLVFEKLRGGTVQQLCLCLLSQLGPVCLSVSKESEELILNA